MMPMTIYVLKSLSQQAGVLKTHPLGCVTIIWMPILVRMQMLNYYDEMNISSKYGITQRNFSNKFRIFFFVVVFI